MSKQQKTGEKLVGTTGQFNWKNQLDWNIPAEKVVKDVKTYPFQYQTIEKFKHLRTPAEIRLISGPETALLTAGFVVIEGCESQYFFYNF